MKRSSLRRPELPERTPTVHKPLPPGQFREAESASGFNGSDPKTEPQRNPALLALARGRDCLILAPGVHFHDRATVVACHSNLSIHGKAGARKADDHYSVWGCAACHAWLDQGKASAEEKEIVFLDAMLAQHEAWTDITENMLEERQSREAAKWALRLHDELDGA